LKDQGHPVTLGALQEGSSTPVESFLTLKDDWGRPQSIDYILLYEPVGTAIVRRYRAALSKFAVSGRPYQQLSDHVGVVCSVDFA
jgi:hypothetical protein